MREREEDYKANGAMRLIGLVGLIGLMGLVGACSSGQVPEPEKPEPLQTVIAFSANQQEQEEVTRAATPLEDLSTTFQVWGYKDYEYKEGENTLTSYQLVMSDYVVNWTANTAGTTTSNTHDWEYVGQGDDQSIKYWDWSAKAYRFFGYAPGKGTAAVHEDPSDTSSPIVTPAVEPATVTAIGGLPIDVPTAEQVTLTASIDGSSEATRDAAPYFSELWYSTGALPDYAGKEFGKPVELRFIKPFAKVRFIFTSSDGLSINRSLIDDISFHPSDGSNVPTKGSITVSYPLKGSTKETWITTATGGEKSLYIDYYEPTGETIVPTLTTYPNQPQHWYYVLPALTQGSYTVEASVDHKQVQTATVPANFMSWKPGFQYTYVFKITKTGEITFDLVQVAINNWTPGGEPKNKIVYNW